MRGNEIMRRVEGQSRLEMRGKTEAISLTRLK